MRTNSITTKKNITIKKIVTIITALVLAAAMCGLLSACGEDETVEETVEITTPSEEAETEQPLYEKAAEQDADEEGEEGEEASAKEETGETSQYAKIYTDCDSEMKTATAQYVKTLNSKKSSLSKSELYDETQNKIKDLEKVYDGGKDKMVEAMLASTEDDGKEYKKYFKKMTEAYTEYSREITSVYTDAF